MSGNVWRVLYKGERVAEARRVLEATTDGIVILGRAPALWRASIDSQAPDGSVMVVQLWPIDPHIDPTTTILELPRPEGTC